MHHKNGQRDDNKPVNIVILSRTEHARGHTSLPGIRDVLGRFNNKIRHELQMGRAGILAGRFEGERIPAIKNERAIVRTF